MDVIDNTGDISIPAGPAEFSGTGMGQDVKPASGCDLYRHFDADNVLLYVGISYSTFHRLSQHRERSPWFMSIAKVTIERFPTREAALAAEAVAIRTEMPLHNLKKPSADNLRMPAFCQKPMAAAASTSAENKVSVHAAEDNSSLVGMFGYTRTDAGEINYQFKIIRELPNEKYAVQLFSFMDGRPTNVKIWTLLDIEACDLYVSEEEWNWTYFRESAERSGRSTGDAEDAYELHRKMVRGNI